MRLEMPADFAEDMSCWNCCKHLDSDTRVGVTPDSRRRRTMIRE